jgi:hypothetical protein
LLSGNGLLVKVLACSLENELFRKTGNNREDARHSASPLTSNVHTWLTEYLERHSDHPPHENIVVTELPLTNQYLLKNGSYNLMEMFDHPIKWKCRQLSLPCKD